MPAPWQAYQKLYYEKKLKAIVDKEYAEYLKTVKEGEKPKTRIQIQTEISRREYGKESEQVQLMVEEYRMGLMPEDANQSEEQRVQRYQ